MISVSNAYKKAMSKRLRDRAYISVGIGVVNQKAQENGTLSGDFAYWSKGNVFDTNKKNVEYATLEENYFKADGSMYFIPKDEDNLQLLNNGITTNDFLQPIRIDFQEIFSLKGITLEFGSVYPTEFTIETQEKTLNYTNDSDRFFTSDVLGDTNYIVITPIAMVGGEQRFRLQNVLMGVGLAYSNAQTKDLSITEFVSTISEELPSEDLSFTFYDEENRFDVDDENSFIDFLETMQKVTVSFGITTEDKTVDWNQIATLYLKDWKAQKGIVSITATDRLTQMEDEYTLANRIYDRTAYEEAESIFADAGLQPDEYYIDDYLNDVALHNPMPSGTHKECLQILANACRCIIRQDENGIIRIVANFANVLDPYDFDISTNGVAEWSKPQNLFVGSDVVYADMTQDFFKADGGMFFLPRNKDYIETSYVSEQIADENGNFDKNLIPYPYYNTTKTMNGVTFTDNGDGTITANGTATDEAVFMVSNWNNGNLKLQENVMYTLSGCPSGGSEETYYLQWVSSTDDGSKWLWGYGADIGDGKTRTAKIIDGSQALNSFFRIVIEAGTTVNNLTFKPMLEVGNKTTSYQPYQQNPKITVAMPASYTYFGLGINFGGNPPEEMIIHTYNNDVLDESKTYKYLASSNYFYEEFKNFNKLVFEFTKGYPNNRVLINHITFGDLSDYVLERHDMTSQPVGFKEKRVKAIKCKVFTYDIDEQGYPQEIEDDVYAVKVISPVGEIKTVQNPLVSTQEHAELLAEWIGNYFANNISYDVNYRGEPRISAADIIHMESNVLDNLQVEVTKHTLNYNGAFSGSLELRRALKMGG